MSDRLTDPLRDPGAQRCLRVFSGAPWTLDDLIEGCYGNGATAGEAITDSAHLAAQLGIAFAAEGREAGLSSDDALYDALSKMMGTGRAEELGRAFKDDSSDSGQENMPDIEVGLDEVERRLLHGLQQRTSGRSASLGSPEPQGGFVQVPEDLVRSIHESYAKVSEYGFVTDADLLAWLRENGG